MMKQISEDHQKILLELGLFFREHRLYDGLTISDVANDLDLHKTTIARAEHGCNITLSSLLVLADYYQIPISQIFKD